MSADLSHSVHKISAKASSNPDGSRIHIVTFGKKGTRSKRKQHLICGMRSTTRGPAWWKKQNRNQKADYHAYTPVCKYIGTIGKSIDVTEAPSTGCFGSHSDSRLKSWVKSKLRGKGDMLALNGSLRKREISKSTITRGMTPMQRWGREHSGSAERLTATDTGDSSKFGSSASLEKYQSD